MNQWRTAIVDQDGYKMPARLLGHPEQETEISQRAKAFQSRELHKVMLLSMA